MTRPEILLFESDADTCGRLEAFLSQNGYRVRTANTLAQGRSLAVQANADLLIVNMVLDDGTAFDLAREWTASGRPALGLSDVFYGAASRLLLRDQIGLAGVLEVPLDEGELLDQLQRVLPEAGEDRELAELEAEGGTTVETEFRHWRPPAVDPTQTPLTGSLTGSDVAAVLARLAMERVNGALMLVLDEIKKLVYFDDGVPVGIKSNLLEECLGQMLAKEGRISMGACERSFEERRRTGQPQGEVLVMMGVLSPKELDEAVKRQFLFKLHQLFTWKEGYYRYRDATIPPAYHAQPLSDPTNLIWHAIDRTRPVERAHAHLGSVLASPMQWSEEGLDVSRLELDEECRAVYDLAVGGYTAVEALGATQDPDRALLLLYALTAMGAVTYLSA